VNESLKAKFAGVANFLDTDHVGLCGWLVDPGWLARDGFGREIRSVAAAALSPRLEPLATAFEGVDTDTIGAAMRAAHSADRDAGSALGESAMASRVDGVTASARMASTTSTVHLPMRSRFTQKRGAHRTPTGAVRKFIDWCCRPAQT
jgi:hypothetical protein